MQPKRGMRTVGVLPHGLHQRQGRGLVIILSRQQHGVAQSNLQVAQLSKGAAQ